jgi:ABC-2 type transport system ATP-binding protein
MWEKMREIILQTKNLTKKYGNVSVVDNFNMKLYKGDIYGLIGKNGAGKTTLIRMLTSLSKKYSGEIILFGEDKESEIEKIRNRMGCVVETPEFYRKLTAYQNLEYYRILKGIPEKNIIKNTLKTVGLENTGKKKFKDFSLGMKQRLGLALALLNCPDFIILDEPVNGLDPSGIIELRQTIQKLNEEQGITFIISSHILSELSLVANRYGIINEGKLVKELTKEELNDECKVGLSIIVDDISKASGAIETKLNTTNYKVLNNNEIRLYEYLDNPSRVMEILGQTGIKISSFKQIGDSLEDYFMSVIGGNLI